MTMPDERFRAVVQTEKFLKEILATPRVPKNIKDGARWCLRHYPNEWEMRRVTEGHGETLFQIEMEPLYRMVKQFEQDTEEGKNK